MAQIRRTSEITREQAETEVDLSRAIRQTREHRGGIALFRMAEIISEELDWAELKALSDYLVGYSKAKSKKRLEEIEKAKP